MAYNRVWFDRDRYALTLGGGKISNTGRYLVLLPPINGATAASGTPYFTGPEGVTPHGGNTGAPGSVVPGWTPDLRNSENRIAGALPVTF